MGPEGAQFMMELLSWSLNAVDRVFSTRRAGSGEPACPDGTFMSGYIMDGWGKWRVICLAALDVEDVEDVEDVYVFAFMATGMIALGCGIFMLYRKMRKIATELTSVRADNAEFMALMRAEVATNREEMVKLRAAKAAEDSDE